jgi:hypothetical protein
MRVALRMLAGVLLLPAFGVWAQSPESPDLLPDSQLPPSARAPEDYEDFQQDVRKDIATFAGRLPQPPRAPSRSVVKDVVGQVLSVEPGWVWIQQGDEAVPLAVTPETRVAGNLREGREVRARYEARGELDGVALRLEVSPARRGPAQPMDENTRLRTLVPSEGESRGPASPMP